MTEKKEELIAVWDGIFQGTKYLTPAQNEARDKLFAQNRKKLWKSLLWFIIIFIGIPIALFLFIIVIA